MLFKPGFKVSLMLLAAVVVWALGAGQALAAGHPGPGPVEIMASPACKAMAGGKALAVVKAPCRPHGSRPWVLVVRPSCSCKGLRRHKLVVRVVHGPCCSRPVRVVVRPVRQRCCKRFVKVEIIHLYKKAMAGTPCYKPCAKPCVKPCAKPCVKPCVNPCRNRPLAALRPPKRPHPPLVSPWRPGPGHWPPVDRPTGPENDGLSWGRPQHPSRPDVSPVAPDQDSGVLTPGGVRPGPGLTQWGDAGTLNQGQPQLAN